MEGLIVLKASDLDQLMHEIRSVKDELRSLRELEEELKSYSIEQTAKFLNLHYNSVRKLVIKRKLEPRFLEGESGKYTIPLWSIKKYLAVKEPGRL